MARYLKIAAMAFFVVSNHLQATPEQDFWKWFQENENSLFSFEKDRERVFDSLAAAMHRVHPDLTFEFGPNVGDHREFVISAGGIKEAFPKVISLHDAAPKLPRWTFIKFRPRREAMDVRYGGLFVRANEIFFTAESEDKKVGITLFISGCTPENHETMLGIAFLVLDQALGEFDVATSVGSIEVKPLTDAPTSKKPLKELSKTFDRIGFSNGTHA